LRLRPQHQQQRVACVAAAFAGVESRGDCPALPVAIRFVFVASSLHPPRSLRLHDPSCLLHIARAGRLHRQCHIAGEHSRSAGAAVVHRFCPRPSRLRAQAYGCEYSPAFMTMTQFALVAAVSFPSQLRRKFKRELPFAWHALTVALFFACSVLANLACVLCFSRRFPLFFTFPSCFPAVFSFLFSPATSPPVQLCTPSLHATHRLADTPSTFPSPFTKCFAREICLRPFSSTWSCSARSECCHHRTRMPSGASFMHWRVVTPAAQILCFSNCVRAGSQRRHLLGHSS
jgi:hypothetical protein